MGKHTFPGGIHPPSHKWTADKTVEDVPFATRLVVPMAQSLGAPSVPVVAAGDKVRRGQLIGRPDGFISAAVHAPTSGTVTGIERVTDASTGQTLDAVALQPDGEDAWADGCDQPRQWRDMDADAIRKAVADCGVVGMGGATFPTHVKLTPPPGKTIDTVLLNGAECEPYLTCDYRTMLDRPDDMRTGLEICLKATGARRGIVCIEDNKPAAIETLRKTLADADALEVCVLETKYPQGAEKQLILAALGREVPTGGLPADAGVVVQNVQTACAIADAVTRARPVTERVLTVSGDAAARPGNFRARLGTPVCRVMEQAGVAGTFEELIFGGPMMGKDQFATAIYIKKGVSGILVFRKAAVWDGGPCIRCGACVRHCPAYLNPSRLSVLAEVFLDGDLDAIAAAMDFGLMDCILCGTCAYVCPSRRRMVHLIEMLRGERRNALQRQREKERAQAADLKREADKVAR